MIKTKTKEQIVKKIYLFLNKLNKSHNNRSRNKTDKV